MTCRRPRRSRARAACAWALGSALLCGCGGAASGTGESSTSEATAASTTADGPDVSTGATGEPTSSGAVDGTSTTASSGTTATTDSGGATDSTATTDSGGATDGTGTTGPVAVCGDGVVAGDEVCDDGNQDDGDTCLGSCVAAVCGDGVLHVGVEACDDGNADDLDACSDACVQATCFDKIHNGGETDLDCGGACKQGCKFGQVCEVDLDCQAKSCQGGTCASGLTLPNCPGDPDVTAATVFASVVAPHCGPCHVAGGSAGGLNMLDAATMQANLVGVKAQTAAMLRVTPGDLDHSYLVYKLLDLAYYVAGGSGEGMPPGGPLSDAEMCVVIDWISSGAK